MTTTAVSTTIEIPTTGMCCTDDAARVSEGVSKLPGVRAVTALSAAERVTVTFDPDVVTAQQIREAIARAGFTVVSPDGQTQPPSARTAGNVIAWGSLGMIAAVVLVAAVGERLGLFNRALERLPWWIPALAILLGGWRVFHGVLQAAWQRRITSHTLMTAGVIAAAAIGQWTTAALIVFFMRFADWLEEITSERSRRAIQRLTTLQPVTARVLRGGAEVEVAAGDVKPGEVVIIRTGERLPVDGEVIEGLAPVDESSITGESVPVDKAVGDRVFAATIAQSGFLRVRATGVGSDTTFSRIVCLVEEAEAQKAPVQRFADRFSTFYLPTVLLIALGTYLITGEVINAVAVLVVACACAITLATPVVVLASVGNAASTGLLIKGGIALEQLARVDTVVMDKTGTLTRGVPELTDVLPFADATEQGLLQAVTDVEARSEHPLAKSIVRAAAARGITPREVASFHSLPGRGVRGGVGGWVWTIGNRRLLSDAAIPLTDDAEERARTLEQQGRTVFFVARDETVVGLIAVADILRPEVRAALAELTGLGVRRLLLLTGDNERVAAAIAGGLGLEYRAGLLPNDKIAAVRELQAGGSVVMMVGDGVNDAPALAQADVGVAMGAIGSAVAIEAADVALMRDDWSMVPQSIRIGRRAARTIRQNLAFTALYNVVGISLAFMGLLPPVWAAAAQSLPDVAIMLNSARLLRGGAPRTGRATAKDLAHA